MASEKKGKTDKARISELRVQKKALEKQRQRVAKREKKRQKRAEKEAAAREEHQLIQSTQQSVPILDVLRSIIITKDGRYLKLMEFAPLNFLMYSHLDRNMIADSFQQMLKVVPVRVQFKVFSRKAKVETLVKAMTEARKNESNELCQKMQEEYIELIRDTALREGVTRRFLVILEFADEVATDGTDFKAIVASLNQTAARVRNYLEQAGNVFLPSCETDEGVTGLLYELLNRRASETELFEDRANLVYEHYMKEQAAKGVQNVPPIPATEFIVPAWIDFKHMRHIAVDGKLYTYGYFTAEGYPNYVVAGWLSSFVNACEGVDVDIFMDKVPKHKVQNSIGRNIRNNRSKLKETSDTSTEANNVASIIKSGFYLLDGISNGEDFFYTHVLITVTADTIKELNYRYNELEKMAHAMGVKMRRTILQMESAFESTLPLCKIAPDLKRKSRRNMLTSGAASLYPFISFELQDPNGIMLGVNRSNNSLVSVDVFDTSVHSSGHGAICGKSGYGKTFTAQLLAIRMRLLKIQTIIVTPMKGREDYLRACTQIDGQFISYGPGSPFAINLCDIHIPDTAGLEEIEGESGEFSILAQKVQELKGFFQLAVRDITQEEEQLMDAHIYKVYERYGLTDDNSTVCIPGTNEPKLCPLLGEIIVEFGKDPVLRRVANICQPMVDGSLSVFNRRTNVDLKNLYIVFDLAGLKGEVLALFMYVVMVFCMSKMKENRLEKKIIFFEELWHMISGDTPVFVAQYIKSMYKVARAFNCAVWSMTQEISDFFALNDGEFGKAIIGNAECKICLHLDKTEAQMMRGVMELTDDEFKKIMKLPRGQGLLSTGNSKLFVDFKASPFETEVITTDPQYLRKKLEERQAAEVSQASENN